MNNQLNKNISVRYQYSWKRIKIDEEWMDCANYHDAEQISDMIESLMHRGLTLNHYLSFDITMIVIVE